MFTSKQIILEPDYKNLLRSIISEYSTIEDYKKDYNNYFNNMKVIFYTKNKPDSIYSTINIDGKYYMSMTIDEMREIIEKCYDASEFSNELLTNIIRYLPYNFFDDIGMCLPFKKKTIINDINASFIPNNRDPILILDDLRSLDTFIGKYNKIMHSYELRKLCSLTFRFNASISTMSEVCDIDKSVTKFLLKENNDIVFDKPKLNPNLSEINEVRQRTIHTLYNSTYDESYLSNDVLHKFIVTKSIEEWIIIMNNSDIFNNGLLNILKSYRNIYKLFTGE